MEKNKDDEAALAFLRDEGFELLALFKQVRAKVQRDLIVEIVRAFVVGQPQTNGTSVAPVKLI